MKRNTIIFGFIIIIFITPIFCANIFIIKPNNRYENNIENYQPENLKEDLVKEQRDGTFIYSINGKRYLAEYITEKKLEDMKKALDFRDQMKIIILLLMAMVRDMHLPQRRIWKNY